jgi:alkylation response protein AidB-like acyl-CoA dehydrogenase
VSEGRDLLVETAADLFKRTTPLLGRDSDSEAALRARVWKDVELAELATLGVAPETGGAGGDLGDACAVLRMAARFAPPIPLAETQLATWLAAGAGLRVPAGPLAVGPTSFRELPRLEADGRFAADSLRSVPFAGGVDHLVLLARLKELPHVAVVELAGTSRTDSTSLSGEPWATVDLAGVRPIDIAPFELDTDELMARGALLRAQQIAGALSRVLELSVDYARVRVQFGRPIARFQAIQHHLADIAAETVAAGVAAEAAADLAQSGRTLEAATIAKSRTGLASRAAAIAHQVHGAIGVTEEHPLHLFTRRIWDWRDDFGSDVEWSGCLGRKVARAGGPALWAEVSEIA